ncbi:MAG: DUF4214 domain-containing protein [Planctomycetaceae bacterium]|nr:DUF4214 domain-containing protein [Planctomycetaceae bacterium]
MRALLTINPLTGAPAELASSSELVAAPLAAEIPVAALPLDALELNDTIATATVLGSLPEITLRDLSIDSEDDVDFFKYTAHTTGQLIVRAHYDPADGGLQLTFRDAFGADITPTVTISAAGSYFIAPVVGQRPYYIEVNGIDDAENFYTLEIENFPAPVPTGVDLDPASDTGSSDSDNVTQDTTPTFSIQTGVMNFIDVDHDNVLDPTELAALTAAQAATGLSTGIAVEVTLINTSDPAQAPVVGFADPLSGSFPIVYRFTPEAPLPAGVYLVTANTRIFDGAFPSQSGRSGPSIPLAVTIDVTAPTAPAPDLLQSSDSGFANFDNVTNVTQPAFDGTAEQRAKVYVLAQQFTSGGVPIGTPRVIGQGVVGSDLSDGVADGLGHWEVTVEPLIDGFYDIFTRFEDAAGIVSPNSETLRVVIDTTAPNTPLLDVVSSSDSGRNNVDDLTNDNRPFVTMRGNATNAGGPSNPLPNDVIFRVYLRPDGALPTSEILVYDSSVEFAALTSLSSLTRQITTVLNNPAGAPLPDGAHNLKLEVEDRAGNISHDFLLPIIVDTSGPTVKFGVATALTGLVADSDTGSPIDPALFNDLITSDTTPKFAGQAGADAIVRVIADVNMNGVLDAGDQLIGQTTAVPLDGNQAEPLGYWEIQSTLDVNQIFGTRDGLRRFFVTAVDPAGNETGIDDEEPDPLQILEIFIDTQGPRIEGVSVTGFEDFDLFATKPETQGPTPLVDSLSIFVSDLPERIVPGDFNYAAVIEALAETAGNYRLVGDHTGVIPITEVQVLFNPTANGNPAAARIILSFAQPLPDDRYTLIVSDNITDPAGNRLDGENNADQPNGEPNFPTGDGVAGGSFTTRFTVDSRPEIGIWSSSSVQVDINGNFTWDPTNADQTNRDLTFVMGNTSDYIFAGNFTDLNGDVAGFDKLGVYGRINGQWQWRVDTDNDGVLDLFINDPANINGFPIAGNFDGNLDNGDEVGVFDGVNFWLDTNHDYNVDTKIVSSLRGHPLAGDFDGDGIDDLATYRNDTGDFQFNLSGSAGGLNGAVNATIHFDFPGVMQRPVAADMDGDGIDDIGLRVAGDNFAGSQGVAEWYFLISNRPRRRGEEVVPNTPGTVEALNHPFSPTPLGNDLFARFGDELGIPVAGNFDPPLLPKAPSSSNGGSSGGSTATTATQANALVRSLYRDILGREADPSGLKAFSAQVVAGATAAQVADQLVSSTEYLGKVVDSYYATYLQRKADPAGRAAWIAELQGGKTPDQVIASFLQSAEYASRNASNTAFVDGLYRDLLGRNADSAGRNSWVAQLNSGKSRTEVIASFLGSQERREKIVDQVYRQVFKRSADPIGLKAFATQLAAPDFTRVDLEASLAASDEYFARVYG